MSKYILVETITQYRMRYVVEVPLDHNEREVPCSAEQWAQDTVVSEEASEFSQLWLGETIVSAHEITQDKIITMCDEDNPYIKSWTNEQKINTFVTTYNETRDNNVSRS
jgi:hypothetical protein